MTTLHLPKRKVNGARPVVTAKTPPKARPAPAKTPVKPGRRDELRRMLPIPLPVVFRGAIRPLTLGANKALRALLPLPVSYPDAMRLDKLRAAIDRWCMEYTSRVEYLAALAAPGSQRHDLDGRAVDEVSEAHREHAARRLAALEAVDEALSSD